MIFNSYPLLGAFIIGLSKAGFATGLGMVTTPLLATAFPAREAIGIILPMLCFADRITITLYWEKWDFSIILNHKLLVISYFLTFLIAYHLAFTADVSAVTPTSDQYSRSLVNQGNLARLHKVFDKARAGQPLVIGAIGGSITQGSNATQANYRYVNRVAQWWQDNFPESNAVSNLKNSGIGATNSLYGAHRISDDLLAYQPDFIIVEYAVNDGGNPDRKETIEGLIRQILNVPNHPAVLLLFMMINSGGTASNVQDDHILVGNQYDIPMISYKDALWPDIQSGSIAWSFITDDNTHPTDNGMEYTAKFITKFLQAKLQEYTGPAETIPVTPTPKYTDAFEHTMRFKPGNLTPVSNNGWSVVSATEWLFDTSRPVSYWFANSPSSEIVFWVPGDIVTMVYWKTNNTASGAPYPGEIDAFIESRSVQQFDGLAIGTWNGFQGYHGVGIVDSGIGSGNHNLYVKLLSQTSSGGHDFQIREILVAGVANNNDTTAPPNITTINDGTGSDINSTNSTTELSANWNASVDNESGIAKYWYAIGTHPSGTDVTSLVDWTDNCPATFVTRTGLTLTAGVTYYFSVKSENWVGMQSSTATSNGQYVVVVTSTITPPPKPKPAEGIKTYPNPCDFKAGVKMKFVISGDAGGTVKVYTLKRMLVKSLTALAGANAEWDGTNEDGEKVAKGVYIYKITGTNGDNITAKLAVIR